MSFETDLKFLNSRLEVLLKEIEKASDRHEENAMMASSNTPLRGWHEGSSNAYHTVHKQLVEWKERYDKFIADAQKTYERLVGLERAIGESLNHL